MNRPGQSPLNAINAHAEHTASSDSTPAIAHIPRKPGTDIRLDSASEAAAANDAVPIPGRQHIRSDQPITFIDEVPINGTNQRVAVAERQPGQADILQRIAGRSRQTGGFHVFGATRLLRASIQFSAIRHVHGAREHVLQLRNQLVGLVNAMNPGLVSGGGGCKELEAVVRMSSAMEPQLEVSVLLEIPDRSDIRVIDELIAKLAPLIEQLTKGTKTRASTTEVTTHQLLRAQVAFDPGTFSLAAAAGHTLAGRIVDLHNFTCLARERVHKRNADILATANSMLAATGAAIGNKRTTWTAVDDPGVPLVIWYRDQHGHLAGRISLPVQAEHADYIGASTCTAAKVPCTYPLTPAVAAIGLAQSLTNLHAHAAEAVAQGDSGQHAYDLALLAGARDSEIVHVVKALLSAQSIHLDLAIAALDKLRRR